MKRKSAEMDALFLPAKITVILNRLQAGEGPRPPSKIAPTTTGCSGVPRDFHRIPSISQRAENTGHALDSGGQRSATPPAPGGPRFLATNLLRPPAQAVSPLRSATAVQGAFPPFEKLPKSSILTVEVVGEKYQDGN
jgi:hypothetical protein